jgi:hypothetical protein
MGSVTRTARRPFQLFLWVGGRCRREAVRSRGTFDPVASCVIGMAAFARYMRIDEPMVGQPVEGDVDEDLALREALSRCDPEVSVDLRTSRSTASWCDVVRGEIATIVVALYRLRTGYQRCWRLTFGLRVDTWFPVSIQIVLQLAVGNCARPFTYVPLVAHQG